jgi:hypothetical protein
MTFDSTTDRDGMQADSKRPWTWIPIEARVPPEFAG